MTWEPSPSCLSCSESQLSIPSQQHGELEIPVTSGWLTWSGDLMIANVVAFLTWCPAGSIQGVTAFYKGFIPNFGRLGSWNVIMFLTLEQVVFNFLALSVLSCCACLGCFSQFAERINLESHFTIRGWILQFHWSILSASDVCSQVKKLFIQEVPAPSSAE